MMTVLRCDECDRPAFLRKQSTGRTRNGYLIMKKVYHRVCPCGGDVKPVIE